MLSKKRRVGRHLFNKIFPKTRISSTDFFTVRFVESEKKKETRFSIIVSKKISKTAVGRNLIRRRVSRVLEIMRGRIAHSYIVLIYCKKNTHNAPFAILEKEVERSLLKIGILDVG